MARLANRQIRLKADRRAPGAARAAIQDVLDETELTSLRDDAVLLTTELTTNAVLHAGTDIELQIDVNEIRLRVSVSDSRRGELPSVDSTDMLQRPMSLTGRGLSLVDQLSDAWGTTHDKSGKAVWFELRRGSSGGRMAAADFPSAGLWHLPAGSSSEPMTGLAGSVQMDDPERDRTTRVLRQLVALAGVGGARLRVDRCDGYGEQTLAWAGETWGGQEALPASRPPDDTPGGREDFRVDELHVPVPLGSPWRGELSVFSADGRTLAGAPLAGSMGDGSTVAGPAVAGSATDRAALDGAASHVRQLAELSAQSIGLMLDNDRLRATDLRRRASLTFTAEASDLLAQSLDIELTTALIPRLIVPRLGEWCAVYRCVDSDSTHGDSLELAAATHADEPATTALLAALDDPINRHVLRDAVNPGRHLTLSTSVDGIAVPLTVRDQRLGVLAVGRPARGRHDGEELAMIADLAHRAGLALDNARLHAERRRVANTLQQALLPPALPDVDGLGFAAEYIPAMGAADVGGDFYDVLQLPDGRLLMAIGDVAGKGVAAATVTGLVRNVIRILARDGRSVPEIMQRINETLADRGAGRFATLAIAMVRPDGPRLEAKLYLAGHDRPVLVRDDGATTPVGATGTALGLLDDIRTNEVTLSMAPGDTLVFFTDGVTERRRGADFFGVERVYQVLSALAGHDADIVVARLRAATLGFSTEAPRDDIAILAMRNEH